MDEVISSVVETWNPADPTRPTSMGFHGSDDYLRIRFEDYICAMLSSTKYADFWQRVTRSKWRFRLPTHRQRAASVLNS